MTGITLRIEDKKNTEGRRYNAMHRVGFERLINVRILGRETTMNGTHTHLCLSLRTARTILRHVQQLTLF